MRKATTKMSTRLLHEKSVNKFSSGLIKSPKRESYIDLRCFDAFDAKGVALKQKTGPKNGTRFQQGCSFD